MAFQVKGKEEPIAVFEPLGAGAALRTKVANNFLDRGDHADHLQVRASRDVENVLLPTRPSQNAMFTLHKAVIHCRDAV